jgi:PKD domain
MKLRAALIVVAVMLLGLAAWSQDHPKVEISIDYSYLHYAAIDYTFHGTQIGRTYNLEGGGGSVVWDFSRFFAFKAELQGYGSETRSVVIPPGNPYLPAGGSANVNGDLFTYLFGPQVGRRYGVFRPYAHALVGGAHSNVYGNAYNFLTFTQAGASPSNNAFAANVGVGLDIAVGQRFAIRPFEISYLYTNFSNKLSNNQNSWRYLGGVVFNFGGKPPVPPSAVCSASPASITVGEPVTVTATGSNFNPKHTLTYLWTISGGKLSSTNTQTATVDTTGMSDGTHTADATITDPKGPKNANVAHCGANFNVNVPHNPPQVTCSANPTTVQPGESSTITASATSPDKVQISSYAYTASAGTVTGSGESATLSTTPDMGGQTVNVTVTATDARGLTGTCTARVAVAAPPTISCVNIEDWGECTFEKDPKRPWRVDNDCKDTLDKLALRLQQTPNGKLKVVGYTDEKEVVSEQTIGAQRAVNVKFYMTQDELGPKADATRIEPRQGGTKGKATHFYFVPEGSLCSGQVVEGTPVDENAIQGQSRSAAGHGKKAKKAAAPPPAQ